MKTINLRSEEVQLLMTEAKVQHRFPVKPQPIWNIEKDGNIYNGELTDFVKVDGHPQWREHFADKNCKFKSGDVIAVREPFFDELDDEESLYHHCPEGNPRFTYKADWDSQGLEQGLMRFKPASQMPERAIRFYLHVRKVYIQQLEEISDEDAINEGFQQGYFDQNFYAIMGYSRSKYHALLEDFVGEECDEIPESPASWYNWVYSERYQKGIYNEKEWMWVLEFIMKDHA